MHDVDYATSTEVEPQALLDLYNSVGWTTYTSDLALLQTAIANSLRVVTAWRDGTLVGLARVVGDGATIAYLQDILVRPTAHRSGIGKQLAALAFEPFEHVRQHVLLTDDEPGQRAFYEALGFTEAHDVAPHELRAFVRFSE